MGLEFRVHSPLTLKQFSKALCTPPAAEMCAPTNFRLSAASVARAENSASGFRGSPAADTAFLPPEAEPAFFLAAPRIFFGGGPSSLGVPAVCSALAPSSAADASSGSAFVLLPFLEPFGGDVVPPFSSVLVVFVPVHTTSREHHQHTRPEPSKAAPAEAARSHHKTDS